MSPTSALDNQLAQNFYLLPYARRYGNEWEMNFWDVIYYLAAHQGLPIRTTARSIATLMSGGTLDDSRYSTVRHHFMRYWREATEAGWLVECTPDNKKAEKANTDNLRFNFRGAKRVYVFNLRHYPPDPANYILKPRGYVGRGWIGIVAGAYAKRLLNFILSHPYLRFRDDQTIPIQTYPLVDLLKEFQEQVAQETGLSSHQGRTVKAFDFLQKLKLVKCTGDQCQVNWPAFAAASPVVHNNFQTGQLVYHADWLTAKAEDASRARLALNILHQGQWPFPTFWQIFNDLAHLPADHVEIIRQQLAEYASAGVGPPAWTDLVHQVSHTIFEALMPRSVKSKVAHLDFAHSANWHIPLLLSDHVIKRLRGRQEVIAQAHLLVAVLPQEQAYNLSTYQVASVTFTLTNSTGVPFEPAQTWPVRYGDFTQHFVTNVTHSLQNMAMLDDVWLDIRLHPAQEGWEGRAWLEIKIEQR